jgi:hypothetical protein
MPGRLATRVAMRRCVSRKVRACSRSRCAARNVASPSPAIPKPDNKNSAMRARSGVEVILIVPTGGTKNQSASTSPQSVATAPGANPPRHETSTTATRKVSMGASVRIIGLSARRTPSASSGSKTASAYRTKCSLPADKEAAVCLDSSRLHNPVLELFSSRRCQGERRCRASLRSGALRSTISSRKVPVARRLFSCTHFRET